MGLGARQFSSVGEQARKLWYVLVGIAAAVVLALLLNTSMSVVRTSEYERPYSRRDGIVAVGTHRIGLKVSITTMRATCTYRSPVPVCAPRCSSSIKTCLLPM